MIAAIASILLTYTLHSLVFGLVALIAATLFVGHAGFRCTLWKVALISPVLTVAVAIARPENGRLSITAVAGRVVRVTPATIDVDVREIRGRPKSRIERVRDPVGTATAGFFIACALLGILRGAVFVARRRRFIRKIDLAARGPIVSHRCLRGTPAVEVDSVNVPVALASGVVALPRGFFASGSERSIDAILLHERAHIERHDPAWIDVARLIAALTPWQPLNRLIVDRFERDAELAADARALALGADASGLVEGLAHFASRALLPSPAGASLVRSESPLVQRARHALDGTDRRPRRRTVAVAAGLFVLLASTMAALPSITAGFAPGPDGVGQRVEQREIEVTR